MADTITICGRTFNPKHLALLLQPILKSEGVAGALEVIAQQAAAESRTDPIPPEDAYHFSAGIAAQRAFLLGCFVSQGGSVIIEPLKAAVANLQAGKKGKADRAKGGSKGKRTSKHNAKLVNKLYKDAINSTEKYPTTAALLADVAFRYQESTGLEISPSTIRRLVAR